MPFFQNCDELAQLCHKLADEWGIGDVSAIGDVSDLMYKICRNVPHGPTAKMEAVTNGETPPGWDPLPVIQKVTSGELHGWSCHAASTVTAAFLWSRGFTVWLDVTHRRDLNAPPVDLHTTVRFMMNDTMYLLDPYHLVGPVPIHSNLSVGDISVCPYGMLEKREDDKYVWFTHNKSRTTLLKYALFASHVDPLGLRAVCDISVNFSGVQNRQAVSCGHPSCFARVSEQENGCWSVEVLHFATGEAFNISDLSKKDAFQILKNPQQ